MLHLRQEARATWTLAWPIMIGQLASTGTSFVDAVMAGHVSAGDLAAVSVGASIWVMLIVTLIGLNLAASPLVAHAVGAQRHAEVPPLVQQALYQGLCWALLAWLIALAASPIFPHLGLPSEVAAKAHDFLIAVSWGLVPFALFRVLYGYSASLGQTKPMMVISLIGLALNVPANWMLIYGHFGFPAMGGVGCGWATAFCMWVTLLMMVGWIRYAPVYRATYPFRRWQRIDWRRQRELFRLGAPMGVMFFVEVSAFGGIALLMARLGTTSVAAHQIALNVASLTFMIPSALGTALTVRVGHALGSGDVRRAREIGNAGLVLGLIVACGLATMIIVGRTQIASWYTTDAAVLALAGVLLLYAGLFQLADATQVVAAGILRGYKVTRQPMLVHLTAFWLVGIPLGYALAFGWHGRHGSGAAGYWQALVLALVCAASLLVWLYLKKSRAALAR
ncbi:MATE family efflux transporter [Jeongeupia chitinilytica]|uniref:Multidrug-efflux transporter n=1 Tax=Jeongeupia chitinilytica TaxID=1041641 RepID=A0ABQ3GYT0_9NEIS|nr:MATE family efflux transporter [Jeongeupia chitinilytica]GHD61603.1 MATE family efflux transporter [Jeongeupia chitinilytica]